MALLAILDEQETGVSISRCNPGLEIAALSTRFAESHSSLGICEEVETIFTHFLEELIIKRTKNCYAGGGSRVLHRFMLVENISVSTVGRRLIPGKITHHII